MTDPYIEFLTQKAVIAQATGVINVRPSDIHPALKPHQRDIVLWAVGGGRRAIFAAFGLGKSLIQLEIARLILSKEGGKALVVCPLGVRQEFKRDAGLIGVAPMFVRRTEDTQEDGVYLTNYESIRDGKLDPRGFKVVSLDEAAILRGFGGTKTFREFMKLYEGTSNYRFVATATPDPNEYIELLAYAAFLDIMDVGQAKTRFFKRDSAHADKLTLHPHKEREFWLWVASWAVFVQRPSDLGYPDEGYALPETKINWHEVASDHKRVIVDRNGQSKLFSDVSYGVSEASKEKRDSLPARIEKLMELRAEDPVAHRIIWHDLEAERHAIEKAIPAAVSVYGNQDLDEREQAIIDFSDGRFQELAAKPAIAGSGCNFQRHCSWSIFLGIGFKFNDFIQAIHRIYRFLQTDAVRIDLIYTDAERSIREVLEGKWRRYNEQTAKMAEIIQEYGLADISLAAELKRSIGIERREISGDNYRLVNNDCVLEMRETEENSVGLILTSIPFGTQYEYSPSYNDFGHTDDNAHFWEQMDFLSPELLRVLQPGRIMAIHIKDRISPGGLTGLGFQTVQPFHAEAIFHYLKHGFAFMGMVTIVTDVVRENNQTYRLGWTEQCKDGTKMGRGMPEYLLLFRKPPTDRSNGYADVPVVKSKDDYSLPHWQVDANGFARSSGDRFLTPDELRSLPHDVIYKRWREWNINHVYSYGEHVGIGHEMRNAGRLPVTFNLLPPHSWHPDVWTDVARMRTMNTLQAAKNKQQHLCPLQFDIVDRTIISFSMEGETVLDPFGGLMTVPYCALKLGRKGIGVELNPRYFEDGAAYVKSVASLIDVPTLFELTDVVARGGTAKSVLPTERK